MLLLNALTQERHSLLCIVAQQELPVRTSRILAVALLACAASAPSVAQQSGAGTQVLGAEIQSWLNADGFAIAGLNPATGCFFMIRTSSDGRRQAVDCPNRPPPFIVLGEGKVVGNQFCSKFTYPDGTTADLCYDIFRIGENKYETRSGGAARLVFYRLIR